MNVGSERTRQRFAQKKTVDWTVHLSIILLGLRTAYKNDVKASLAEIAQGSTLRFPSEFFTSRPLNSLPDTTEFSKSLMQAMSSIRPPETAWHDKPTFGSSDMQLRHRPPSPHSTVPGGPKVLHRADKSFQILINERPTNISIDLYRGTGASIANYVATSRDVLSEHLLDRRLKKRLK